jgi:hypothetical protein
MEEEEMDTQYSKTRTAAPEGVERRRRTAAEVVLGKDRLQEEAGTTSGEWELPVEDMDPLPDRAEEVGRARKTTAALLIQDVGMIALVLAYMLIFYSEIGSQTYAFAHVSRPRGVGQPVPLISRPK